jgi:hypothetical protein
MIALHDDSRTRVRGRQNDHWLAQAGFGLFVACLMVCLLSLYLGGPVDF